MGYADPDIFERSNAKAEAYRDADIFGMPMERKRPDMVKLGLEGFPDAVRQVLPNFGPVSKLAAGAASYPVDISTRLSQLANGGELTPEQKQRTIFNRTARQESGAFQGGNILPQVALGAAVGPGVLANAAVGAANGYLGTPVMEGESGLLNAGGQALAGGGGALGAKLLTGSPLVNISPEAQTLLDRNVTPTLGQTASSSPSRFDRILGRAEEKLSSVPIIGDVIGMARDRARTDFTREAMNQSLPPGAKPLTALGPEGVEQMKSAFSNAYDDIYKNTNVQMDKTLKDALRVAVDSTTVPLSQSGRNAYREVIRRNVLERLPAGTSIPATDAKREIEAGLGKAVRDYTGPMASPEDKAIGEALKNARQAFRDMMARNVGPDAAGLPAVDRAYPDMKAIEKAVEAAKAQGGIFSPFQLQSRTRVGSDLRDFANAGQAVLPNRVPNSGTADRLLGAGAANALLGLSAAVPVAASAYTGAPFLSAAALAPLAYSRTGARWMQGAVTPEQIQMLAPYLAGGARGLLAQ